MQLAHMCKWAPIVWAPLLSAVQKKTIEWQALLLCSRICEVTMQHSFTHAQIVDLDKCIWLMDTCILGSPKLTHLWKPKNHYLSHLPLEILRWGPPRGYWCEPFEHENQYSKGSVIHGNFANVLLNVAEGKAPLVALESL